LKEVRLLGDAFDECTEWRKLWVFLSEAVRKKCPSLHILFTSRPERVIEEDVKSLEIPSFDLRSSGIDRDIESFVLDVLANDSRYRGIPEEGKGIIRETLIGRANGMYVGFV
jgi:hypothetical protein